MSTDPNTRESSSAAAVESLPELLIRQLADDHIRTDLQYRELRIQQASLEQRYHDRIGAMTRDEYETVEREIRRLAERLAKPAEELEAWEIVFQAAYNPTSPLRPYFWPELTAASSEQKEPADNASKLEGEPTPPVEPETIKVDRLENDGADLAARVTFAAEAVEKSGLPWTYVELCKKISNNGKRGIDVSTLRRWKHDHLKVAKALRRTSWPEAIEPDAHQPRN